MKEKIKIRFPNELWWDEVPYENIIGLTSFEVSYLTDDTCFVNIIDSNGNRMNIEVYRKDYDKIMDQKAFRLKFNLKKHGF